jgi:hypothetical protein
VRCAPPQDTSASATGAQTRRVRVVDMAPASSRAPREVPCPCCPHPCPCPCPSCPCCPHPCPCPCPCPCPHRQCRGSPPPSRRRLRARCERVPERAGRETGGRRLGPRLRGRLHAACLFRQARVAREHLQTAVSPLSRRELFTLHDTLARVSSFASRPRRGSDAWNVGGSQSAHEVLGRSVGLALSPRD